MRPEQHRDVAPRVRDAATNEFAVLPRGVRILVAVDPGVSPPRAALVADLIRRVAELRGGQARVTATSALPDLMACNIHPAAVAADDQADVVVGRVVPGRLCLDVAPVEGSLPDAVPPLAARLLILGEPYRRPVALDGPALVAAGERLDRWRDLVAAWAGFPSAAMPPPAVVAMFDRAGDDLDTPGVLGLLDRLAGDDGVSPGARFEFFVYADRLLGLDLAAHLAG